MGRCAFCVLRFEFGVLGFEFWGLSLRSDVKAPRCLSASAQEIPPL